MRLLIPWEEITDEWKKDPEYLKEYERLEPEFALKRELIRARARAHLTQVEIAKRMGTTQSAVARIESRTRSVSIKTLERYAAATGSHLQIRLTK